MATLDQLIESVRGQIAAKLTERETHTGAIAAIRDTLTDDVMELTADQARQVAEHDAARGTIDAAVSELRGREQELVREKAADDAQTALAREIGPVPAARAAVVSEPNPVYRRDDPETSFFRDLFESQRGDRAAQDRLVRSQQRAATTGTGVGGEFAPPAWLVADFVELARADRVAADVVGGETLQDGISSISLPKITTGTGTAVQQTENTTVAETGIVTTQVSSTIATIAGKQKVSIQMLKQSAIPFDRVILGDLAASYAVSLDAQVIGGTGANGQLRGMNTAGNKVNWNVTSPSVVSTTSANSFYSQALSALSAMASNRKRGGTEWIMHPRRWYWILSALDSTYRPLVSTSGPGVNQAAAGGVNPEGLAGTFLGLPVYLDGNIPINISGTTGTQNDLVFLTRRSDISLFESPLELASFDATHADDAAVLFRALGFAAFIPDRHPHSVQVITGDGLKTPSL